MPDATSQSCRARTNERGSTPPCAPERDDLVVDVVSDVGTAEIGDAGALAPMHNELLFAGAEVRLVRWNGAAAAELQPGEPADAVGSGEVQKTPVDPVHMLAHLLEHEHVTPEVRLEGSADEVTEDGDVEGSSGDAGRDRRFHALGCAVREKSQSPRNRQVSIGARDIGGHRPMRQVLE